MQQLQLMHIFYLPDFDHKIYVIVIIINVHALCFISFQLYCHARYGKLNHLLLYIFRVLIMIILMLLRQVPIFYLHAYRNLMMSVYECPKFLLCHLKSQWLLDCNIAMSI